MHATTAKLKRSRGVIERYREYLPVSDSTPIISAGRGDYAADLLPAIEQTGRPRLRCFRQERRSQPDGFVQGSRHDRGCVQSDGARRNSAHLRFNREYVGFGGGLCGAGGNFVRSDFACWKNRERQIAAGFRLRSKNRRH